MGWENYHIYLFNVGRLQYGEGVSEWAEFAQRVNAKRVMLQDITLRKGARFLYTYDMGDGWEHEIWVEEICEASPEQVRCLEGARMLPPGGLWWSPRLRGTAGNCVRPKTSGISGTSGVVGRGL
jgi:hypothetical protein